MAGGEGSRLRPLTSRYPKPLVPVVGTPVIEHILRLLRDHGIRQVVVTLAYLGADVRNHLGDGSELDMEIEYVVEDRPLGTAGSVRNAASLLDETFLVISGDAMTDLDLTSVIYRHREREAMASIVLHQVPNPLEYGVVVTDDHGNVKRFLEKPSWGEVFSDHANTGIYVVEPKVLEHIKPDTPADWSQDVFPAMLKRRQRLHGIVVDDYWCDIGSIQSYLQANWDALDGRVRCHIPGRREGEAWIGEGVEFGLGVHIEGPAFIGDEVKLKAGAWLNDHVVIDKYAIVDDYAKVSNSIVWPHSYIGEGSRLRQSIICRNVTLKNSALVEENSVIGDDCVVGHGSRIRAGVKIWPNKEIEPGSTVNESVIWAGEWRRGLFSSYGMGGLINVELTPEFCARLGAAFYEMGDIEYLNPVRAYQEHLLASVNVEAIRDTGFRLLVDYDYSEASVVLPGILNELGVTTIPLNAGLREGMHHRTVPEETALISRTVRADVGCMIGPTAERIVVIDDTGTVLTPHETFGVLVSWWLRERPGIVLAPAATPEWISTLVRDSGGTFTATPAEPASVLRASAVPGTCLASDADGGFVWPYYLAAFDAMYTLVKLLELRATIGTPLSEARRALPSSAYVTATEFCPWEEKGRVMRVLLDTHREEAVDLVDGIKVFVDDGFVLVRPDPDEPAYHIVASVADEEHGRTLVAKYARLVRDAMQHNGVQPVSEAKVATE